MNHIGKRIRKACECCRARKIKCDGSRPHCMQCRESGRHCVFGEDGRPNARVSKEAIQAINNKMADLEYALLQGGLAGNHQALDESSSSQYAAFDVRRSLAPDCAVSADRITPDVHMQNDHHILSDTASASRHQEHYSVDCPSKGSTVNASSLEINALVHSESGLSLHGPTSSLRPPLSLLSSRSSPNRVKSVSPSALEKERNLKDWKLQLFAQTSLERQKEYYHIIHGNTDLDGVDPTLAFNLLGFYWNHQHNTYLVTYRPAIMHSLATGGPYCNKLLLNSLFYTGALQSGHESLMNEEKDPATLGSRFFERFQQLVSSQVEISSIPTIAALIVMGSAVLTRGKQTLGWMYSGMAFRMIADLGLHLDPDKVNHSQFISKETTYNLTATDIEQQRRVFWGAFMQDRFQSLFYGRRPEISLFHGFEPPTELLDTFDELETWSPHRDTSASNEYNPTPTYVPQQKHNISNRDSLLKLAHLTSEIIELFYIPSTTKLAFDQALHAIDSIQTKLDLWFQQLPTHLQYEPGKDPAPPPHRFYPHSTYHTLHILLYRPFISGGHLASIGIDERLAKRRCISAAMYIYRLAQAYRESFTLRKAPYLFCYALFSAATVIPVDLETNPSHLSVVNFFWEALKEVQRGTNFGLKKPIIIIRNLFSRAGIDLDNPRPVQDRAVRGQISSTGQTGSHCRTPDAIGPNIFDESSLNFLENDDFWQSNEDFLLENDNPIDYEADVLFGLFCSSTDAGLAF